MKKEKRILSIIFLLSLLPMQLSFFGSVRGVQEIRGLIILYNPITIISIIGFLIGIWIKFKNKKVNKIICLVSLILIIIIELFWFIFWHYFYIDSKISLAMSIKMTYPEFYLGLLCSVIMLVVYCTLIRKDNKENE